MAASRIFRLALVVLALGLASAPASARADYAEVACSVAAPRALRRKISVAAAPSTARPERTAIFAALQKLSPPAENTLVLHEKLYLAHRALLL